MAKLLLHEETEMDGLLTLGVGDREVPGAWRVAGIGGTYSVPRIEPPRERLARLLKRRLCNGMIGIRAVENEGDNGADRGSYGAGGEQKTIFSVPIVLDVDLEGRLKSIWDWDGRQRTLTRPYHSVVLRKYCHS